MFYDDGFDNKVEEKLKEYEDFFQDDFPLMEFEENKKQLIKTINTCIKKKKKYSVKYKEDEDD